jgi:protein-S-isoprenylcysteine O-methyltransferase Ste14
LPHRQLTYAVGVALVMLGLAFTVWARLHLGRNWSGTVTLKAEHELIRSGPYAYVRHPMYSSVILFAAGVPLLLGSWWGLAFVPVLMCLLGVRAGMEERLLTAGLEGYPQYAARVRYRLIPFVW